MCLKPDQSCVFGFHIYFVAAETGLLSNEAEGLGPVAVNATLSVLVYQGSWILR